MIDVEHTRGGRGASPPGDRPPSAPLPPGACALPATSLYRLAAASSCRLAAKGTAGDGLVR